MPGISGLDSADIRVGDGLYAGRDGGFVSGHFYGHRTIVVKGFFIGADCEQAADLRRVLFSYLRIRYLLPIIITVVGGDRYYTEGYVTDVKADIDYLKGGEFQITLLCPDPIIYEADDEEDEPKYYAKELSVGMNTVGNDGAVDIYPVITVSGIANGIEISNVTSELAMQVDVATSDADDEVVIDMEKRIITLNGAAINEYRSLGSSWWSLLVEENDIFVADTFEEESGGGDYGIEIKYKKGFSGV